MAQSILKNLKLSELVTVREEDPNVVVTPIVTPSSGGIHIATISVGNDSTEIYAKNASSSGSEVDYEQKLTVENPDNKVIVGNLSVSNGDVKEIYTTKEVDTKHIILANNLLLQGNYTLGSIKPDLTSTYTFSQGEVLHDVLLSIFTQETT